MNAIQRALRLSSHDICSVARQASLAFLFAVAATNSTADTVYVDDDAPAGGDGISWATAFAYLQDALATAVDGDDIYVAGGIYRPDRDEAGNVTPGYRLATFQLISGVALYGGYAGLGAINPNQRDIVRYETVLSGDQFGDDVPVACTNATPDCDGHGRRCADGFCILPDRNEENNYHVVTGTGTDETAILDGFTISGGNASGTIFKGAGGGMHNSAGGSPTLTNCTFTGNSASHGGGMYNGDSSPTLTNCTFRGNWGHDGGGMENWMSKPTLNSCTFIANSAGSGGGMDNSHSSPTLTNCTFTGNRSTSRGGGMENWREDRDTNFTVTNCIFRGNTSAVGGALYNLSSTLALSNCILNGNSAFSRGGAVYTLFGVPTLTKCTINGNSARDGGGLYTEEGRVWLTNCRLIGNAADSDGGGMYNDESSPRLTNCIVSGNSAGNDGGGMINTGNGLTRNSRPKVINSTFSGNSAVHEGGGMISASYRSDPTVTNSIFWANNDMGGTGETAQIVGATPAINFSCVQGWTGLLEGTGNMGTNPMFVDWDGSDNTPGTEDDDLRLRLGSPCIDAGDNSALSRDYLDLDDDGDDEELLPVDLGGNPRFIDNPNSPDCPQPDADCGTAPIVDMGAFETGATGPQGPAEPPPGQGVPDEGDQASTPMCGMMGSLSMVLTFFGLAMLRTVRFCTTDRSERAP